MRSEKINFVVFMLGLFVCLGCGAVVPDEDNGGVSESGCGDLQHHCRLGEECLSKEGGGFYCGCKAGMASCSNDKICGTNIMGDDIENCGGCGKKCDGDGVSCESGKCVCYESGKIVDLQTGIFIDGSGSGNSCGICGYKCDNGAGNNEIVCEDGMCVDQSCELGVGGKRKMRCEGECVDLQIDSEHCGRCGVSCGEGECKEGKCVCGEGKVGCGDEGGVCVKQSNEKCGSSCISCSKDEYCTKNGQCVKKGVAVCGESGQLGCRDGEVCDCTKGSKCWGGRCQCGSSLSGVKVCGEFEWCVNDVCLCGKENSSGKKCNEGENCGSDGVCHCGNGLGCKAGERCVEGVCQCGGKVCGKGEKCEEGVCKCGSIVGGCGEVADCKKGECDCKGKVAVYHDEKMEVFRGCEEACFTKTCAVGAVCIESGIFVGCRCPTTGHFLACEGSINSCDSNSGCVKSLPRCGAGTIKLIEQNFTDGTRYYSGCLEKCNGGLCAQGGVCFRKGNPRKEYCACVLEQETSFQSGDECPAGKVCEGTVCK